MAATLTTVAATGTATVAAVPATVTAGFRRSSKEGSTPARTTSPIPPEAQSVRDHRADRAVGSRHPSPPFVTTKAIRKVPAEVAGRRKRIQQIIAETKEEMIAILNHALNTLRARLQLSTVCIKYSLRSSLLSLILITATAVIRAPARHYIHCCD